MNSTVVIWMKPAPKAPRGTMITVIVDAPEATGVGKAAIALVTVFKRIRCNRTADHARGLCRRGGPEGGGAATNAPPARRPDLLYRGTRRVLNCLVVAWAVCCV